jgi:hypothetical protein
MSKGGTWTGWFRRGPAATWEMAAEGETIGQASKRLLAFLRQRRIKLASSLDRIITSGSYPDRGPRRR